jgi:hypothetical protein
MLLNLKQHLFHLFYFILCLQGKVTESRKHLITQQRQKNKCLTKTVKNVAFGIAETIKC